jgi:hypothetical protein
VLVLGGSDDGQLVAVLDALRDRNVPVVFLDHCTTLDAAFDIRAGGGLEIRLDGKQLPLPAVVWSRLKINTLISSWTSETVNEFIRRSEWRGFLSTISAALGDLGIYTLSDVAESGSRIRQLEIAARCGFVVPESTWFVGKAHAERFAAKHERIVAKPIAVRNVPKLEDDLDSYRVLFTMGIEGAEIAAIDPSEFTGAPALFQERIGHGVEHRVIAFRDRAFSYEIKGRIEDKIRPDERILYGANDGRRIYGAQYNFVETSPFVAQATSRFLTEAGLQYGAFDLIKGDSGQWSFIECNPEGQWYAASMFNMDEVAAHFAKLIEGQLHQQRRNTLEPIPEAIA